MDFVLTRHPLKLLRQVSKRLLERAVETLSEVLTSDRICQRDSR